MNNKSLKEEIKEGLKENKYEIVFTFMAISDACCIGYFYNNNIMIGLFLSSLTSLLTGMLIKEVSK